MKRVFFLISFIFLFWSCSTDKFDETKFFDLYTEILTIRAEEQNTEIANQKIQELFSTHNYPEEKFRTDFENQCTNSDAKTFIKKLDSLRQSIYQKQKTTELGYVD